MNAISNNWRIGIRLGFGFDILPLLMLATGPYGIRSVQGLAELAAQPEHLVKQSKV